MRLHRRARLAFVAVLLAGAIGEGAARVLLPRTDSAEVKPAQNEGPLLRVSDPVLGWRMAPSVETVHRNAEYRVSYRTNAQGWRAPRDYERARTPGRVRIAAVGDSFVFGVGVEEEERFPDLLASFLPEAEVLNFGVFGYGTDQAVLTLEREAAAYAPDVALLGHLMEHARRNLAFEHRSPPDETGEVRVDPKPRFVRGENGFELASVQVPPPRTEPADPPAPPPFPLAQSRLLSWIAGRLDALRNRRRPFPEWDAGSEGLTLTQGLVRRFAASARAHDAQPLVVVLGDRVYLDGRLADLADRGPLVRFVEFCASEGIPVVNLLPAFDQAASAGRGPLFFSWDGHWTPEGHRVAAEALARHFRERGWPPD